MAPLPAWADAYLLAERMDDPAILLATITHDDWGAPVQLARNTENVQSRGTTFTRTWFAVDLPTDNDQIPKSQFSMPNIDPTIGQKLKQCINPPQVRLEVVALSHPDEPILSASRLELREVGLNPFQITGQMWGRDYSSDPCGTIVVNPTNFPAIFRNPT